MSPEEFKQLSPGDFIIHKGNGLSYQIVGNYGDHCIGVQTCYASNPGEWNIVSKAGRLDPNEKIYVNN